MTLKLAAPARSTALADREKSATLFNATTRRSIEARLNGKPVHVTVDDLDADLRIIGFGLAAAYLFVVVLRLAQLGWLS